MNEKLIQAQDVFLNGVNQLCNKFGLNNIMAQLYAVLYFSKSPLSLDDMAERLKISKASASINIRALEQYGAVRQVWVKGSRRDYYEAETDISKVVLDRIRSMAQRRLEEVDNILNSASATLKSVKTANGNDKEALEIFEERLNKLEKMRSKAQSLFNLFNSGVLGGVIGNSFKKRGVLKKASR